MQVVGDVKSRGDTGSLCPSAPLGTAWHGARRMRLSTRVIDNNDTSITGNSFLGS